MVSFKGKGVPETVYYSDDGHSVDVPVAVLVNGQSASSSEVLTGALKDNDAAVVVGGADLWKGNCSGNLPSPGRKRAEAYDFLIIIRRRANASMRSESSRMWK